MEFGGNSDQVDRTFPCATPKRQSRLDRSGGLSRESMVLDVPEARGWGIHLHGCLAKKSVSEVEELEARCGDTV